MTGLATLRLTTDAARALTDEVKANAAELWLKLLALYEGDAHLALGHKSWEAYYAHEFGESGSRGWQLLTAARVVRAIDSGGLTNVSPPSEAIARELAPVLKQAPERVPEVWGEVVETHGSEPTAAQVREVVQPRVQPRPTKDERRQADFFENALSSAEVGADEAAKRVKRAIEMENDETRLRAWLATVEDLHTNARTIRAQLKRRLHDAP